MSTTLANLNSLINDRRRDNSSDSVDMLEEGFRAINSTLDIWNSLHDWPWCIKEVNFDYNPNITWYALDDIASDFKSAITIKPYKNIAKDKELWMVSQFKFDSATTKPRRFATSILGAEQFLRIKTVDGIWTTIETAATYNGNGTWVGASAISNVGTDNYEGFDLTTSTKFDYSGTSGTITNSTFNAVNLQSYKDRSNIYFDIFIPEIGNLTSISLKWGSSASDYYSASATTDYLGNSFIVGWNKVKFVWDSSIVVGTPVDTAIDYLQVTIAYSIDPVATNFRIQNFFVSENIPTTLIYYTVNMVQTSGGVQSQKFSNSANTSDLPLWTGRWDMITEAFINSVLQIIFWMTGEITDMQIAQNKIAEIVEPLKRRYPSQVRKPATFIVTDTNL